MHNLPPRSATAMFAAAPAIEQAKNTRRGEKRSAMVKKAKTSVPAMKPSCTADVTCPSAEAASPHSAGRSRSTALPANHSEVPANCDTMMTGRTRAGRTGATAGPPTGSAAASTQRAPGRLCRAGPQGGAPRRVLLDRHDGADQHLPSYVTADAAKMAGISPGRSQRDGSRSIGARNVRRSSSLGFGCPAQLAPQHLADRRLRQRLAEFHVPRPLVPGEMRIAMGDHGFLGE